MQNGPTRRAKISQARDLASRTIKVSDDFAALYTEFTLTGLLDATEDGGLGPDDFSASGAALMSGDNTGLTREDIVAFFQVMGAILGPLTDEQKRIIYRIRSASLPGQPGIF